YDTSQPFDQDTSWGTFIPGQHGVGTKSKGFRGGVFDGRYLYFVPHREGTSAYHGEVLRLDTQGDFYTASSWEAFEPASHGVGVHPEGFQGALFDGRFILFIPYYTQGQYSGEFLRYDTQGTFSDATSWAAYDPGAAAGAPWVGYVGGAFDGRYMYFSPFRSSAGAGGLSGDVLRYDTQAPFDAESSWNAYNPGTEWGVNAVGYMGAVFDGQYVTFVPHTNETAPPGWVIRFDTAQRFDSQASWDRFSASTAAEAFLGAVFDGRYVYLVPFAGVSEVARFDTTAGAAHKILYSGSNQSGGFSSGPFGVSAVVNTGGAAAWVASNKVLAPGSWHHVGLTFDDSTGSVTLILDGTEVGSASVSGLLSATTVPFRMGNFAGGNAHFRGALDAVGFWNRALPLDEVLAHFQRRKFASPEPVAGTPGPEERR
ncbi:MAG: LamG domain-containing protein, partial [Planctomycetota bacterium]